MFYLIGTGLRNWDDMSVKGLSICKNSDKIFLERYTSFINDDEIKSLEEVTGREIIELKRSELENDFRKRILIPSKKKNIVLLVIGDPLTATTHFELLKSCVKEKIGYKVIHASSILTSVSECGLFIYKYGKTCSIPFFEKNYKPTSFFNIISENHKNGAHTLVLLDIKKEKNKYMKISHALKVLLDISNEKKDFFNKKTRSIGVSGLGGENQKIKCGNVNDLLKTDFTSKPRCIIIPGKLNSVEEDYLSIYE